VSKYPAKLQKLIETFEAFPDRDIRAEMLIDYADRFREVPEEIATRPFPETDRVEYCESEAYVWAKENPDGTLKFYFAVENPQGISAKAMAVILDESLSGLAAEEIVEVPTDVAYKIFGKDLTMGKGLGLTGMVAMVKQVAGRFLAR